MSDQTRSTDQFIARRRYVRRGRSASAVFLLLGLVALSGCTGPHAAGPKDVTSSAVRLTFSQSPRSDDPTELGDIAVTLTDGHSLDVHPIVVRIGSRPLTESEVAILRQAITVALTGSTVSFTPQLGSGLDGIRLKLRAAAVDAPPERVSDAFISSFILQ